MIVYSASYGLPEDIVSDRGPQFTSRLCSELFKALGVNISLTSVHDPQSNGQVERLNQELTQFLRSYCNQQQNDWACYVMWAEYAQNSLRKEATVSLCSSVSSATNRLYSLGSVNPQMSLMLMIG